LTLVEEKLFGFVRKLTNKNIKVEILVKTFYEENCIFNKNWKDLNFE